MINKTAIQILLIFLIFLFSILFYLKYFKNSQKISENIFKEDKQNITSKNNSSTYIDNINYISSDTKGNRYQITAEQAEIKIEDSDIMLLENVVAYIFTKDSDAIMITSNFSVYNSKNYDTIFSENVIILYSGHKITGEYLELSFLENLGTISKNVIYKGEKTSLFADKVEINLTTKDTKIFMDDKNKKVLVEVAK
ncbi:LPS export ABC transporter periplasmic protein LptC [Candidatus Pelagibacter sp.]|nr:LPS export ABC transporter periplasmic protein LptC [Candidatus Pelagibacter sp.]